MEENELKKKIKKKIKKGERKSTVRKKALQN